MKSELVDRDDTIHSHDYSESDSGYVSFEDIYSDTGCTIKGRGSNRGSKSDSGRYAYLAPEYETTYGDEHQKQFDPCIRTSETRSFRTRDNARVERDALFQDMRIKADDQERGDRSISCANLSERLLEQQMKVMRDLLQLITIQNTRMRNHSDTGNEFRVMPEKYAGTSSFHTFLAQFENCCEINGWEERDKLLMLKHSLTGDAAAVLWEFGSDRHQSYTELVKHLKIRYGFGGQSELFRMQLKVRKQQEGETLNSLEQDIRKLIVLAYPGETSNILELIARDAFIDAICDRDLALQVLATGPETLESAYQVASKLKFYKDLIHSTEPHKILTAKIDVTLREEAADSEQRQMREEVKEMVQVIQGLAEKVTGLSEDIKKIKNQSRERTGEIQVSCREDSSSDKIRTHRKTMRCFHCNGEGHWKFQCPNKADTEKIGSRRGHRTRLFRNSEVVKKRTVNIPPRSEVGTVLELGEFLNDFEALFGGGEVREDPEEEVTTGQVRAYPVSDPSVPGSSQNEILLVGNSGAPSSLVLGSPRVPGTVSSDKFKHENSHDNTNTNDKHDNTNTNINQSKVYNTGHRNGYSPDVDIDLNPYEDEVNGVVFKRLDDLRDSVCLSSHRNNKSSQKARIGQRPIPRPCAHCPLIIGSRALMRQHIQAEHQDILLTRRRSRPDME